MIMRGGKVGAEEYVESLPMWAKKKNTVQQVREFLGLLLQESASAKESDLLQESTPAKESQSKDIAISR